jgi:hypothetical protein
MRGLIEWRKTGLAPPDSVLQSTRSYREDNDTASDSPRVDRSTEQGKNVVENSRESQPKNQGLPNRGPFLCGGEGARGVIDPVVGWIVPLDRGAYAVPAGGGRSCPWR